MVLPAARPPCCSSPAGCGSCPCSAPPAVTSGPSSPAGRDGRCGTARSASAAASPAPSPTPYSAAPGSALYRWTWRSGHSGPMTQDKILFIVTQWSHQTDGKAEASTHLKLNSVVYWRFIRAAGCNWKTRLMTAEWVIILPGFSPTSDPVHITNHLIHLPYKNIDKYSFQYSWWRETSHSPPEMLNQNGLLTEQKTDSTHANIRSIKQPHGIQPLLL